MFSSFVKDLESHLSIVLGIDKEIINNSFRSFRNENISRNFPSRKFLCSPKLSYPTRYSEQELQDFQGLKETSEFKLWISGINPTTKRKIKIGNKPHIKVGKKFKFKFSPYYYERIGEIDPVSYIAETKQIMDNINNKYQIDMEEFEKSKKIAIEYNKIVDEVIEQIVKLDWDSYVWFEGKRYGIPHFYGGVHKTNYCNGKIEIVHESCSCSTCENWFGDHPPKQVRRCSKCDATDYWKW